MIKLDLLSCIPMRNVDTILQFFGERENLPWTGIAADDVLDEKIKLGLGIEGKFLFWHLRYEKDVLASRKRLGIY